MRTNQVFQDSSQAVPIRPFWSHSLFSPSREHNARGDWDYILTFSWQALQCLQHNGVKSAC